MRLWRCVCGRGEMRRGGKRGHICELIPSPADSPRRHELKRSSLATAEVGLVCGLLYLLWGATVLFDRAQEMILQCVVSKK